MRLHVVAALAVLAPGSACVHAEHRAVVEAREAYERCLAERGGGGDPARCAPEHARLLDEQARYEDRAQQAWGCNAAGSDCGDAPDGPGRGTP